MSEPSLAILSENMRDALRELAHHCRVSVVSGRDLEDVRKMVGLPDLAYVGSHGFEVLGPGEVTPDQERGLEYLPALDRTERELKTAVEVVKGAWVERKKFAMAVHYRSVDDGDVPRLEALFNEVAHRHPELKKMGGKKVFELRPNVDWDKGKVVLYLLDKLHMNGSRVVPLYIGDDVTDEDAFRAIGDRGITILVGDAGQTTRASHVLSDVGEVYTFLKDLVGLFNRETTHGIWTLDYEGFVPEKEKLRESLCTVGNGYFATRGAAPESVAGKSHYPGTYLAGVYNRLDSEIFDHTIENESMVNIPNWLSLSFRLGEDQWFDVSRVELEDYHQELDMRKGVLSRTMRFTDEHGHRTFLKQRRFISMDSPHLAGLETTLTPENWSGALMLRSAVDGRVDNTLVKRYRQLNNHHFGQVIAGSSGREVIWIQGETKQSHIKIAVAARTRVFQDNRPIDLERGTIEELGYIGQDLKIPLKAGRSTRIEKIASVFSSKDRAISESLLEAVDEVNRAESFENLRQSHEKEWENLWSRCQINVEADHGKLAQILNLHVFHLLQTVSIHSIDLDVGVPPEACMEKHTGASSCGTRSSFSRS